MAVRLCGCPCVVETEWMWRATQGRRVRHVGAKAANRSYTTRHGRGPIAIGR